MAKLRSVRIGLVVMLVMTVVVTTGPGAAAQAALCNGLAATITGTDGDDDITGTEGDDVIVALAGNDDIDSLAGNDTICAGDGGDKVDAGDGANYIDAGAGNDEVTTGLGNDHVIGGDGDDKMFTGDGADVVTGDAGNDEIDTGAGGDAITGGDGNDKLTAGAGKDVVSGDNGDDKLYGGDGDDTLVGGPGKDELTGGAGNDLLDGGLGDDKLFGEAGADTLLAGPGKDEIKGGAGNDTIDGGAGDDDIKSGDGNDIISAGAGKDAIEAGAGDDRVSGGDGADKITAGLGNDRVTGDGGNDDIKGNDGDDVLDGGDGIDKIDGGNGFDACVGEDVKNCETDTIGPAEVAVIQIPVDAAPLTFGANTGGFDGVELTINTNGGLYPWDVSVQPAYTRARMHQIIVSELIDIALAEGAPDFESATLTLEYDPAMVVDVAEEKLKIWTYDEELQFWLPVPGDQVVDTVAKTVTANLEHFTVYAVLEMDEDEPEMWRTVIGDTPVFCVPEDVDLGVDVAFAIDTSGSMGGNDPTNLRVTAAKAFVAEMRATDQVGVVSFSSSATTRIGLTLLATQADRDAVNAAVNAAGFASGGTNITAALNTTTGMLSASEVGRPRITILLTDGVGSYTTADAQAAAAAGITVYAVGLGSGADAGILTDIATVTGGEYIQLASADQLVPLYEELGGTIFDDGTDGDSDTLTDCVETNGAFVPGLVFRAGRSIFDSRLVDLLEARPAYITTNPAAADTDGDSYDDGVELVAADMRANPLLELFYGFLIDEGITRYYREISDPNDPFDPGLFVPGDGGGFFEPGLVDVSGLQVDDTTLFQPDRYADRPVIEDRLLGDRVEGGIRVRRAEYDTNPVVYATDELCVENCTEVERLANERNSDNAWYDLGCDKLRGSDFDCEVRNIIEEARGDQNIFQANDDLESYFLQEQVALTCAVETGDLDHCVSGSFRFEYSDVLPDEIDVIVAALTMNDGRWMHYQPMWNEFGLDLGLHVRIDSGDIASFMRYREAILTLWGEWDYIDTATGSRDGFVDENEFYDTIPTLGGTSVAVRDAINFISADRDQFDREHVRIGADWVSFETIRAAMVFTEAYELDPGAAPDLLEDFPLVGKGEKGVDIYTFIEFEPTLVRLFDSAMAFVGPTDRVRQNEYISRLPESTLTGLRNELITAVYVEYGQKIQDWLGPDKGGNWGLVAPWASNAINGAVKGEFPVVIISGQQAAGDGNQWIFHDVGKRYAAFVEVIEADPTPSEFAWENFFAENFPNGDGTIRDGFVALIAAQKETDPQKAQELLFQSNVLLATHEQEGVQLHLEQFDTVLPNTVENWFINLQMGASTELDTDLNPYGEFGLDPDGAGPAGNLVWDLNMLTLDPTGEDASQFNIDTLTFAEGAAPTSGVIDVAAINGIENNGFLIGWDEWKAIGGDPDPANLYGGADANVWWDWEDRMWYLTNLFRILHTEPEIVVPPNGVEIANLAGKFAASTLDKLAID